MWYLHSSNATPKLYFNLFDVFCLAFVVVAFVSMFSEEIHIYLESTNSTQHYVSKLEKFVGKQNTIPIPYNMYAKATLARIIFLRLIVFIQASVKFHENKKVCGMRNATNSIVILAAEIDVEFHIFFFLLALAP